MPDIKIIPPDSITRSLKPPHLPSDIQSGNNEKGILRLLADHPVMDNFRSRTPDLARVKDHLIPMKKSFLVKTPGMQLQPYAAATLTCMMLHLHVYQSSGGRSYAREAFEYALTFACLTGFYILPRVATGKTFHLLVIRGYLSDYPQDLSSALRAVAEFGNYAIMVLLDLQKFHGRKTLKDLYYHVLTTRHSPLPPSKLLFHLFSAVIADSAGDEQETISATTFQLFEMAPMTIINNLRAFASCADIREYYYRCMMLHYTYYALFLGSNHTSDLHQSFDYRLSADAIFPQPLELESRSFDLGFITRVAQILRTRGLKSILIFGRYAPDPLAQVELDEGQIGLDVIYQTVPYRDSDGRFQDTIEGAKLYLRVWFDNGYDREILEMAARSFKGLVSLQSATDEERRAAQWWLTFIHSHPNPHALGSSLLQAELEEYSDRETTIPWTQRAVFHTFSQWVHALQEGNLLRLRELLSLVQATTALLDTNNLAFMVVCDALEFWSVRAGEINDDFGPERSLAVFCQEAKPLLRNLDEFLVPFPLEELKAGAMSTKDASFARLQCARDWAQRSFKEGLPESLDAFKVYASLFQDNIHVGTTAEQKHRILSSETWVQHWSDTAVTAVVRYGGSDCLSLAVEFLEQSRSVTYRHLFQLRQRNIRLGESYPELEKTWLHYSSHIQNTFQHWTQQPNMTDPDNDAVYTIHVLQNDHHKLLQEIREKPGFENFLRPLKYNELSKAATEGPVIMISSDPRTELSHALIILLGREQPIYLQLPEEACYTEVSRYSNDLVLLLAGGEQPTRRGWELDTIPSDKDSLQFQRILEWLWDHVICPILDTLEKAGYTSGRLWWCPSGKFTQLPLHAATLLDPHRSIISSYTPSLELLIDSRQRGPASDDTMMLRRLAAVGLQSCPRRRELQPLYAVKEELELFSQGDGGRQQTIQIKRFEGSNSQVEAVLDAMRSSHIVHLACHGVQDSSDPLNSHLILHDGELSLRALMNENLPFAEFAFLSACQTATGHKELANESVHLAGGFVAAGFKGVVGTLWSIADRDAPCVVRKVYEDMMTQEGGFNVRKAAEGLHRAVQGMIKQGLPPRQWAPFIHVGI